MIFSFVFASSAAAAQTEQNGFFAGDADCSGFVSVEDARSVMRVAVALQKAKTERLPYMDADGSGKITPADSRLILRAALDLAETEKHDFTTKVTLAAGCLTSGKAESVCADCGKKLEYKLAATGHDYEVTSSKKATCTEDGYTEKECARCGDVVRTEKEATGHDWKGTPKKCTRCSLTKEGSVTVGGKTYYYFSDGSCVKDRIYNGKYYDSTGVYTDNAAINAAVKFVNTYSSSGDSASVRLQACYKALMKKCSYQTTYGIPTGKDMDSLAYSMLTTYSGNCYKYAAAFAYIARVLGYDSAVEAGQVWGHNGFYNLHGWTKVKVGGSWYMCDAMMQDRWGDDCYKETVGSYPYAIKHGPVYYLTVSDGVVSWS